MKIFLILHSGEPLVAIQYDVMKCPPVPSEILRQYSEKYDFARAALSHLILDVLPMEDVFYPKSAENLLTIEP